MKVNEIFKSIQGESSYAGLPCSFIRTTGCNLRCSYCDTKYAFEVGEELSVEMILERIKDYKCDLVEITGGEPLLQKDIYSLTERLLEGGYRVLVETNGSIDIGRLDWRVVKILDLKCPDSGESHRMRWENLGKLKPHDEVKFVLSSRKDYDWAKGIIRKYHLEDRCILLSPVFSLLEPEKLASWILQDNLSARLQLQLHKYIWGPMRRGV